MFLRRLTRHLGEQNWTAVGVEFAILVLGVFLGLQAQEWSERRAEAEQEREILSSIAQDLRLERIELQSGQRFLISGICASNHALASLGEAPVTALVLPAISVPGLGVDDATVDVPQTCDLPAGAQERLWSLAVVGFYPTASVSAYETLIGSGKLSIIKDPQLISALQNYYQLWIGLDQGHAGTFRPLRNRAIEVGQRYGLSPFKRIDQASFLTLLREHADLRAVLRTQLEYHALHLQQVTEIDGEAEALLDRLARIGIP